MKKKQTILAVIGCLVLYLWLSWIHAVPSIFHAHFIRTVWDKKYLKCWTQQELESRSDNASPLYITYSLHGRLGNWMFAYASLHGIAKRNNRHGFISVSNGLHGVFDINKTLSWTPDCMEDFHETYGCKYDTRTENLPKVNLTLKQYFQSWKYFRGHELDIRKQFKFLPDIYDRSRNIFRRYKGDNSNVTTVCVHVRRTDMMIPSSTNLGFKSAPLEYIINAMDYMRKKFADKNLNFLVVSDDFDWTSNYLKGPDIAIVPRHHAYIDLAILSMCNHSIVTTGTFGWWGAWLAGGHTVYYKNFPESGSHLDKEFDRSDFYPLDWVAMSTGVVQLSDIDVMIGIFLLVQILH